MRPLRKTALALMSTGALAVSMMSASGAAADPGNGNGNGQDKAVERHAAAQSKSTKEEIRSYWTAERMRNATPRELAKGKGAPAGKGKKSSAAAVEVPEQSEFGKVFFTLGGKDWVCSGTSTDSVNGDVVTTAGHCLNEGPGAYATNFAFVPAYEHGSAPYGTWVATDLYAPSAWVNSGDFDYDMAFAVMEEKNGQSLNEVVGEFPIAFDLGYGLQYQAFGYPAASPYDGQDLWRCAGGTSKDPSGYSIDHRLPCTMTGGSSGGGWITGGVLNSVNSFGYDWDRNAMYGPYFGSVAEQVYTAASNG